MLKVRSCGPIVNSIPSKHEALAQCWADVDPSSTTLGQYQPNIGPTTLMCNRQILWTVRCMSGSNPGRRQLLILFGTAVVHGPESVTVYQLPTTPHEHDEWSHFVLILAMLPEKSWGTYEFRPFFKMATMKM